jgi:hypothetical protein
MPEIMGAGVALLDYDGDGDLDVYFVQGSLLDPAEKLSDALFPPPDRHWPGNRLFRNELIPSGKLQFTDVTEAAGVGHVGYGMGVAVGDYDNDGYPDLYVTNFGHNVLYHNNGNGTFSDVTRKAGVAAGFWSTSSAFLDYDRDGYLDLFVTGYVDFTLKGNKVRHDPMGAREFYTPSIYRPLISRLFRNRGDGTFEDVTERSGIGFKAGPGLGVVCADFNGDGWPDIYVANDEAANHLWLNQKNGTFQEVALRSGAAYSADGSERAGMGATAGDFDNDGDEDILVTNLTGQTHTLYRNDGKGFFETATLQLGLYQPTLPYTGFGVEWFDYDNDGFLDLFVANGAVRILEELRGTPYPYQQRNQLLHNEGGRSFRDVTSRGGAALELPGVARGAAFGDIDNDGDIDIVVANNNGPGRLLLNQTGSRKHWLEIRLEGVKSNRQGLGARVAVLRKSQSPLWRRAHTDGSYLSAHSSIVHFGLGDDAAFEGVAVEWPSGWSEIWTDTRADRKITLREGSGQPWKASASSSGQAKLRFVRK